LVRAVGVAADGHTLVHARGRTAEPASSNTPRSIARK